MLMAASNEAAIGINPDPTNLYEDSIMNQSRTEPILYSEEHPFQFTGGVLPEPGDVVSEGTLKTEDIHDNFLRALRRYGLEDGRYFDVAIDVETMENDILLMYSCFDEITPEGCYFGAHEGDGALIGFWPSSLDDSDVV